MNRIARERERKRHNHTAPSHKIKIVITDINKIINGSSSNENFYIIEPELVEIEEKSVSSE